MVWLRGQTERSGDDICRCEYLQVSGVCWKERQGQPFDYKSFYYCTCGG
jgi:hypothetical protein